MEANDPTERVRICTTIVGRSRAAPTVRDVRWWPPGFVVHVERRLVYPHLGERRRFAARGSAWRSTPSVSQLHLRSVPKVRSVRGLWYIIVELTCETVRPGRLRYPDAVRVASHFQRCGTLNATSYHAQPLPGTGRSVGCDSVVADLVDKFLLVQLRTAVQVEFLGAFVEFGDGPVLVGRRCPTGLADGAAAPVGGGVGDAGGLFLGLALVAEFSPASSSLACCCSRRPRSYRGR